MKLTANMINPIKNQKGITLIATLMILVLGFAVVAIMFRLSTRETKLAGLEQGYTTALDAAKAGTDLFVYMIENQVHNPPAGAGATTPFGTSTSAGRCLQIKMANSTSSWYTTAGWNTAPACPSQASGLATSPDPTVGTDITLTLSNYTVYLKVIDNYASGLAASPPPCATGCFYYTVLARAQAPGSSEHADIQFVYRFDQ